MFEDVTARDNATAPGCDLYVAGFPCQPFSSGGLQQGFNDLRGRGTIFFNVLDYVEKQQPRVFIFENVSGLKSINKGEYFAAILKALDMLGTYNVYHRLLDTKQHGVPHSRKRIYMVGIRKDVDKGDFQFPEPIPCPSFEKFLDRREKGFNLASSLPPRSQSTARINVTNTIRTLKRGGSDPLQEPYIVDCDSTVERSSFKLGISPCITCGRKDGHWVTNRGRRLKKTEMMRLQGMNPTTFKVAVSNHQLGKQLGNTMSVNVLERLLVKLLPAAGLASRKSLVDRWQTGEALRELAATRNKDFGSALPPEMKTAVKADAPRKLTLVSTSSDASDTSRKRKLCRTGSR